MCVTQEIIQSCAGESTVHGSGLNGGPQRDMLTSQTLESRNGTSFVMMLWISRWAHPGRCWRPLDSHVSLEETWGRRQTHRKQTRCHVMLVKAETGVMQPQDKERLEPSGPGRGRKDSPLEPSGGVGSCWVLISHSRCLELWQNNFRGCKNPSVVACSYRLGKWTHTHFNRMRLVSVLSVCRACCLQASGKIPEGWTRWLSSVLQVITEREWKAMLAWLRKLGSKSTF